MAEPTLKGDRQSFGKIGIPKKTCWRLLPNNSFQNKQVTNFLPNFCVGVGVTYGVGAVRIQSQNNNHKLTIPEPKSDNSLTGSEDHTIEKTQIYNPLYSSNSH